MVEWVEVLLEVETVLIACGSQIWPLDIVKLHHKLPRITFSYYQSINQFIKSERTKRPLTSQYKIHDIKYINTHRHIWLLSTAPSHLGVLLRNCGSCSGRIVATLHSHITNLLSYTVPISRFQWRLRWVCADELLSNEDLHSLSWTRHDRAAVEMTVSAAPRLDTPFETITRYSINCAIAERKSARSTEIGVHRARHTVSTLDGFGDEFQVFSGTFNRHECRSEDTECPNNATCSAFVAACKKN